MTAPVADLHADCEQNAQLYGTEFCLATRKPGPCKGAHRPGTPTAPPPPVKQVAVPNAPTAKTPQQLIAERQAADTYTQAYLHAQALATTAGVSGQRHAGVQAAVGDYARALHQHGQAIAADDRARAHAQRAHDSAVARNKAYAASAAAAQARTVAHARAHAARAKLKKAVHVAKFPLTYPAPAGFASDDWASIAELYALPGAQFEELYALTAAAHWMCGVDQFCRNPLHPGPCKGWKHTLHAVAPGAFHAYEKQRVDKLNAYRKARIKALQDAGQPVPKSLLKEITYKIPTAPQAGFTPPTPKEAQQALPATAKEIAAKLAMKHADIAAAKLDKQHAALMNVVQALGQHTDAGKLKKKLADISASQKAKGEPLTAHPVVQNSLKGLAELASQKAGGLSAEQKAQIREDIAQHVEHGVPETPLLVQSALNMGKKKDEEDHKAIQMAAHQGSAQTFLDTYKDVDWSGATPEAKKKAVANLDKIIESTHTTKAQRIAAAALANKINKAKAPGPPKATGPLAHPDMMHAVDTLKGGFTTGEKLHSLSQPGVTKAEFDKLGTGKKAVVDALAEMHDAAPAKVQNIAHKLGIDPLDIKIPGSAAGGPAGHTAHKFEVLADPGASGDGYFENPDGSSGPWGKFGASGVMIRAKGADGQYRYLMVQRGNVDTDKSLAGKWQLPGGALDANENAHQGAARETQEELGASPDYLAAMQSHGEHVYKTAGGWSYTSIAATAPGQFTPKVDGFETSDAKWLTRDEIDAMDKSGQLIPELSGGKIHDNVTSLYPDGKPTGTVPSAGVTPAAPLGPDVAAHVKLAQSVATGATHMTDTKKLDAYAKLTQSEYHALPVQVQHKIQIGLLTAHSKFLSPAKKDAAKKVLDKLGLPKETPQGAGAPHAPGSPLKTSQADHLDAMAQAAAAANGLAHGTSLSTEHKELQAANAKKLLEDHPTDTPEMLATGYASIWMKKHNIAAQVGPGLDMAVQDKAAAEFKHMIETGQKVPPKGGVLEAVDLGLGAQAVADAAGVHAQSSQAGGGVVSPLQHAQAHAAVHELAKGVSMSSLDNIRDLYAQHPANETADDLTGVYAKKWAEKHLENLGLTPGQRSEITAKAQIEMHDMIMKGQLFPPPDGVLEAAVAGHSPSELAAALKTATGLPGGGPTAPVVEPATKLGKGVAISKIPMAKKEAMKAFYKAQSQGSSLNHPTDQVFANILAMAHGFGEPGALLSLSQVIKTIDEQHYAKLDPGLENAHRLEDKIKAWLATPEGAKAAKGMKPDPDLVAAAKAAAGGSPAVHVPASTLPISLKKPPGGPGAFKPGVLSSKFKIHTIDESRTEQAATMSKTGKHWTPAQSSALTSYTGHSGSVNNYLRGKASGTSAVKQQAADIQAAMLPLTHHHLLMRGTGWEQLPEDFRDSTKVKDLIGKTFQEPAFLSASVDGGGFEYHPLRLEIEAPPGTMGAFVEDISKFKGGSEKEMLLAAGTKMKVLGVRQEGSTTFVRVRVVS